MADRRTRDQLRRSNEKLRAAIRRFVAASEAPAGDTCESASKLCQEYGRAYKAMKELMAALPNSEGHDR